MNPTILAVILAILSVGCSSTGLSPVERMLYDVQTNRVELVIPVTNRTEVVSEERVPTGPGTSQLVTVTNYVTEVVLKTNIVEHIELTPGSGAVAVKDAVGLGVGTAAPGAGGLFGALIGTALAAWGAFRARKLNKVATSAVQGIEVVRQILRSTEDGKQIDAQLVSWLKDHQHEAGVAKDIAGLLQKYVRDKDAKRTASAILAMIEERE